MLCARYIEAVRKLKCSGVQCDRTVHLCFVPGWRSFIVLNKLKTNVRFFTQGAYLSGKPMDTCLM